MSEMLLRIAAKSVDEYGYDYHNGEPEITHEVITRSQFVDGMSEYELKNYGLVRVKKVGGSTKLNRVAIEVLKEHGWVHAESAKTRAERKLYFDEYFILDEKGNPAYFTYEPKFKKLDLDNLEDHFIVQLAKGASIVQKVSLKSVLKPSDYKKLLKAEKDLNEKAKKKAASLAKKAAKVREKEIAKAKAILAELGSK